MKDKTKVIFRRFPDGEVIALFPEIIGGTSPYTCMSYMHIGQHGSASAEPIGQPASKEEYKHLLGELREIVGYTDIEVCHRFNDSHLAKRRKFLEWASAVNE